MQDGVEHQSWWTEFAPYISTAFGVALTALMGAVAWGINDRRQVGKELEELKALVADHARQLQQIMAIHQRWRDGELLKEEYTALYNELNTQLHVIETKVDNLLDRTHGRRRRAGEDDE